MKRLCLILLLAAACSPGPMSMQERGPTRRVVTGDQRLEYRFDSAADWELFGLAGDLAHFDLVMGWLEAYVVGDRGYIMTRNSASHSDVIVNATLRQTEGSAGSAYGVVCRADERDNGYYFLINGAGEFSISVGTDARPELFELMPWQYHSAIRPFRQSNDLRAVCVEDYLALFINDVFMAETYDFEFTSGTLGLTIGAVNRPAAAQFDNVLVRDARIVGSG